MVEGSGFRGSDLPKLFIRCLSLPEHGSTWKTGGRPKDPPKKSRKLVLSVLRV